MAYWDKLVKVPSKQHLVDIRSNVKNSQFATSLFEFSGACSGCGETPYVKLVSQLFGDREMIANATGCSSIYSASIPSTPYTTNAKGQGPAFDNSLFEVFCEFGMGMVLGNKKMKERVTMLLGEATANEDCPAEFKALADEWIEKQNDAEETKRLAALLKPFIKGGAEAGCPVCAELQTLDHYLVKRSQWIIGGDGASYDIGYGGLAHVIASGEDVNLLVLDTEVYSNTGGQSSKATPLGAIAQFAAQGKRIRKKDLGKILRRAKRLLRRRAATTYGYVYVAQILRRAKRTSSSGHGCRPRPDAQGHPRGRGMARSLYHHRLCSLYPLDLWSLCLQRTPHWPTRARTPSPSTRRRPARPLVACLSKNWADFHDLTLSSSVATRHSPNKFGSALAAPSVPARRGSLPLRQEGLPQRGRGTPFPTFGRLPVAFRRGPAHGPTPLQDLRPQAG